MHVYVYVYVEVSRCLLTILPENGNNLFPKRSVYFYDVLFFYFRNTRSKTARKSKVSWKKRNIVFSIIIFNPCVQSLLDSGSFCSNNINSLLSLAFLERVIVRYIFVCYCYFQFLFKTYFKGVYSYCLKLIQKEVFHIFLDIGTVTP
jgi:hypothetical protein